MDGSERGAAVAHDERHARTWRLPDEIAAVLAREIRSSLLRPGDQLPSEKQLGARFGVSRTVVREAVSQLKFEGLVEAYQGRGAFVADSERHSVFRISPECFAKRKELGQILELQTSIAAQAAALAAQRRTARQLGEMRLSLGRMAEALVAREQAAELWVAAENRFFEVIFESSGNTFLVEFLAFLQARIGARLRSVVVKNARAVELSASVMPEHRAIYDAIRQRDAERAQELTSLHFTAAAKRLASRADVADV